MARRKKRPNNKRPRKRGKKTRTSGKLEALKRRVDHIKQRAKIRPYQKLICQNVLKRLKSHYKNFGNQTPYGYGVFVLNSEPSDADKVLLTLIEPNVYRAIKEFQNWSDRLDANIAEIEALAIQNIHKSMNKRFDPKIA